MKIRPRRFSDFWDHPRNPNYRRLEAMTRSGTVPALTLVGPHGSGKTAVAYVLGMATSCLSTDADELMPCGRCKSCYAIQAPSEKDRQRGAFIEIDGAEGKSDDRMLKEIRDAWSSTFGSKTSLWHMYDPPANPRLPWVVLIDEAHRMSLRVKESLL